MEERQNEEIIENTKAEKKWYVYIHTCKHNNKVYIGITQQSLERRWQKGYGYKNNQYFWRAIQKYGWDSGFEHIVFAENLTQEQAEHMEKMLIALYDSTNPNYGYNISVGGGCSHLGVKHSEDVRNKISINRTGKMTGENHPLYGMHPSEEAIKKMSKAKNKPVVQLDKENNFINEFPSRLIAFEATGIDNGHIGDCCNGRRKTAGGYKWMTKEKYENTIKINMEN